MSLSRFQRGVRQLGMGAGSRLARPPAVLPEPDIRPGGSGVLEIDAFVGQTHVFGGTDNVVFDLATLTGEGPIVIGTVDIPETVASTFTVPDGFQIDEVVFDLAWTPAGTFVSKMFIQSFEVPYQREVEITAPAASGTLAASDPISTAFDVGVLPFVGDATVSLLLANNSGGTTTTTSGHLSIQWSST